MKTRRLAWLGLVCLALGFAGCDYSPVAAPSSPAPAPRGDTAEAKQAKTEEERLMKDAILDNILTQIRSSAMTPGGQNFAIATAGLNQYFEGTPSEAYALSAESRALLARQLDPRAIESLQDKTFTLRDARHLEDCLLYRGIANRIGGSGDDLTRVRRVFDWMVRQVELVPAGSLAPPGLQHVYARPFDVLMRGMATEAGGFWSERGWLFLSLCRQLGLDAGLLTFTPPGAQAPIAWICAVLIDGKLRLFDQRIGLAVPGRDGKGVATLDDALSDPVILDQLDLPGQSSYLASSALLARSPSKIGILIDSSPGYCAPRMRLLQDRLTGVLKVVLFRDPEAQRARLDRALGRHSGGVRLWELPITVEALLFSDPKFVESTQKSQPYFYPELPLIFARTKQLRGEVTDAIERYMSFSFVENAKLRDGKTPMSPEVQRALDVHATYFLALCHLEQNHPDQAAFFFAKTVRLLSEPGHERAYYAMFHLGALANLARLLEAKGALADAITLFTQPDPTSQGHGNLLVARDLVWRNPTAPPAGLSPLPAH